MKNNNHLSLTSHAKELAKDALGNLAWTRCITPLDSKGSIVLHNSQVRSLVVKYPPLLAWFVLLDAVQNRAQRLVELKARLNNSTSTTERSSRPFRVLQAMLICHSYDSQKNAGFPSQERIAICDLPYLDILKWGIFQPAQMWSFSVLRITCICEGRSRTCNIFLSNW